MPCLAFAFYECLASQNHCVIEILILSNIILIITSTFDQAWFFGEFKDLGSGTGNCRITSKIFSVSPKSYLNQGGGPKKKNSIKKDRWTKKLI